MIADSSRFETLYLTVEHEHLTIIFPKNKQKIIENSLAKIDGINPKSFMQIEQLLLKCNGYIRE